MTFKLGADFNVASRQMYYHAKCEDALIGGTLSVDTTERRLSYRKVRASSSSSSPFCSISSSPFCCCCSTSSSPPFCSSPPSSSPFWVISYSSFSSSSSYSSYPYSFFSFSSSCAVGVSQSPSRSPSHVYMELPPPFLLHPQAIPLAAPGQPAMGGFEVVLNASASYSPLLTHGVGDYRPSLSVGIHTGNQAVRMVQGNSFDLRQTVRLTDRIHAEVCGNLEVPMPDSQYKWNPGQDGAVAIGSGDFHANVSQINAVLTF